MVFFSLEGIVGAGKSTVLSNLSKKSDNVNIISEPVHLYSSYKSKYSNAHFNPLQQSYEDLQKNSIPAQLHIIDSSLQYYMKSLMKHDNNALIMSERCVLSPLPFIQTYYTMNFHSLFAKTYLEDYLFRLLDEKKDFYPDYFIYLQAEPEMCFQRIKKRGRVEEEKVSRNFLFHLDDAYHRFFEQFNSIPVISLNIAECSKVDEITDKILSVIDDKSK